MNGDTNFRRLFGKLAPAPVGEFPPGDPQPDPEPGETRFLSADYAGTLDDGRFGAPTDDVDSGEEPASDDRVVEGIDDREGFSLAVSLYDIDDLDDPSPLLARESVDLKFSWSEATWDHRAFNVIEEATSVLSADGTEETGLVLLPFTGSDGDGTRSGVQLFTFSMTTVTRRGAMLQETPVRRSFRPDDDDLVANLSDVEISLYDAEDPDAPTALGRVELAPNYTDLFVVGDYAVRRRDRFDYYTWWFDAPFGVAEPVDRLEVVPLAGDVDRSTAVAMLEIPFGSRLYQVGTSVTSSGPVYYTGAIECRTLRRVDGTVTPQTCVGAIYRCDDGACTGCATPRRDAASSTCRGACS